MTLTRRQSNNEWSGGIAAKIQTKKIRMRISAGKSFSSIFWDHYGILQTDYLPKEQTMNAEFYLSLLVKLKEILREKRRGKITKLFFILHDNVPAHGALATQKKLAYLYSQCLVHVPYSPDMAPSHFDL